MSLATFMINHGNSFSLTDDWNLHEDTDHLCSRFLGEDF